MTSTIPVCPACHKPLVTLEWKGVEIDYCVQCRGVWLDSGEFVAIIGAGVSEDEFWRKRARREQPETSAHGKRLCPRCDRRLKCVRVASGDGPIELDRCPKDHGWWFDAGELHKILMVESHLNEEMKRVSRFLSEIFGEAGNSSSRA